MTKLERLKYENTLPYTNELGIVQYPGRPNPVYQLDSIDRLPMLKWKRVTNFIHANIISDYYYCDTDKTTYICRIAFFKIRQKHRRMTELEQRIYKKARPAIELAKKEIPSKTLTNRYISYHFFCDGCVDELRYDIELNEFMICYWKGKGEAIMIGDASALFAEEDLERCEFVIPDKL